DVAPRRTHHADDLEVGPELAALATLENEAKGLALSFRNRRKSDVHDMDADIGQHAGELVLVLGRDGDAGHLLAVAERVVIDANLFDRRKLQVVGEALRVASQLLERLLQVYRMNVIHATRPFDAVLRAACAPTARARPCAAGHS